MKALTVTGKVLTTILRYTDNPKIPLQQVSILLTILERGEIPMADLPKLAGVEQSSVSRNVVILGPGLNPKEPGYGLLDAFEDPFYRRRKLVKLTPRGQALKAEIEAIQGG